MYMHFLYALIPLMINMKRKRLDITETAIQNQEQNQEQKQKKKIQVIVNTMESELQREEVEKLGTIIYELPMIGSYVVEIYEEDKGTLEGIKGVVRVEQDMQLTAQMDTARQLINDNASIEGSNMGKGVTVAVLDTGIYPHMDLTYRENRIIAFKDFTDKKEYPYDNNGHGTHVAGIIAGDGYESNGKYAGIAPLANLVGLKVLRKDGSGNISDVLAALQWVVDHGEEYNIKIINLSVGMKDVEGEQSALVRGVDAAWDRGFVVICAAGNNGPDSGSVTTPGISRKVITVGASDDKETVDIQDDSISNYSGRGPTRACIKKPDVVAPGSNITSLNCNLDQTSKLTAFEKVGYVKKSGTSMATPIVSGLIARLMSDFDYLTNREIKLALKYSTISLGLEDAHQGWGLIDAQKLYSYFRQRYHQRSNSII